MTTIRDRSDDNEDSRMRKRNRRARRRSFQSHGKRSKEREQERQRARKRTHIRSCPDPAVLQISGGKRRSERQRPTQECMGRWTLG